MPESELDSVMVAAGGMNDHTTDAAAAAASIALPASEPAAPKRKYVKQPGANPPGRKHKSGTQPIARAVTTDAAPSGIAPKTVMQDRRTKEQVAASEAHLKSQLAALQSSAPNAEQEERARKVVMSLCASAEFGLYALGMPDAAPTQQEAEWVADTGKRPLAPYLNVAGPVADWGPFLAAIAAMGWMGYKRQMVANKKKGESEPTKPLPGTQPATPVASLVEAETILAPPPGEKMQGPH